MRVDEAVEGRRIKEWLSGTFQGIGARRRSPRFLLKALLHPQHLHSGKGKGCTIGRSAKSWLCWFFSEIIYWDKWKNDIDYIDYINLMGFFFIHLFSYFISFLFPFFFFEGKEEFVERQHNWALQCSRSLGFSGSWWIGGWRQRTGTMIEREGKKWLEDRIKLRRQKKWKKKKKRGE